MDQLSLNSPSKKRMLGGNDTTPRKRERGNITPLREEQSSEITPRKKRNDDGAKSNYPGHLPIEQVKETEAPTQMKSLSYSVSETEQMLKRSCFNLIAYTMEKFDIQRGIDLRPSGYVDLVSNPRYMQAVCIQAYGKESHTPCNNCRSRLFGNNRIFRGGCVVIDATDGHLDHKDMFAGCCGNCRYAGLDFTCSKVTHALIGNYTADDSDTEPKPSDIYFNPEMDLPCLGDRFDYNTVEGATEAAGYLFHMYSKLTERARLLQTGRTPKAFLDYSNNKSGKIISGGVHDTSVSEAPNYGVEL
ncbi:hypothetical protein NHQ30_011372 [Ciborinia camelliae]|nr:hypothetical protein NHQ30_011372 [Ciborinia camelliae]